MYVRAVMDRAWVGPDSYRMMTGPDSDVHAADALDGSGH